MKRLFLTSSSFNVATDVAKRLGKKGLRLTCIKTASEVEKGDLWWLKRDQDTLANAGFIVTDYTITGKTKTEIQKDLGSTDIIFFSGGNTFYLLQQIQQSGCADIIRGFVEKGMPYIGSSAGSQIAGPDIWPVYRLDNADQAPKIKGYVGLGLVDFVVFPHWGSDDFKELYLNQRLEHAYTDKHKIILLTDNQYIVIEDDMYKIVEVEK
ncbi:MAG: Peptidase E [Microgenomates group bacterium GW2011_GWC1_43_11]|nr:MAG: Peptidase E [Candidatus Gottesmanbacteria bacterium GW2011_GWA1_42_26]KKS87262.1 MAG: Peptidase E [Microgenomates group bacterium GW2011_GWC1_43_11]HCM81934.1 hypothetical protein [Patescibacteria group bacterium]